MNRRPKRKAPPVLPGQLDMFVVTPEIAKTHSNERSRSVVTPQNTRGTSSTKRAAKSVVPVSSAPKDRIPSAILRVQEAATRVGLSVSTLNKMRCDGRGPRFIKLMGKVVGYAVEDLDAWIEKRRTICEGTQRG